MRALCGFLRSGESKTKKKEYDGHARFYELDCWEKDLNYVEITRLYKVGLIAVCFEVDE